MMLEVVSFLLDTNDVVNSPETMERKIKEVERYVNINFPEVLKADVVICQTEEVTFRTHFIMSAHRLTTFLDIKAEVTNVKQAQSVVMTKAGDAMDLDSFSKGSLQGASEGCGKGKNSEVTCCFARRNHRASECRKRQKGSGKGKSEGSKNGDGRGARKGKKGLGGQSGKSGHMSEDWP